jgi:hypothetical protein
LPPEPESEHDSPFAALRALKDKKP